MDPRLRPRGDREDGARPGSAGRPLQGLLRGRAPRRRGKRRLQRLRHERGLRLARGDAAALVLQVRAADADRLQPGLHAGRARPVSRVLPRADRQVRGVVRRRPARRGAHEQARRERGRAQTRARSRAKSRRRSDSSNLRRGRRVRCCARTITSATRTARRSSTSRSSSIRTRCRTCRNQAEVRDLRLLAARGSRALARVEGRTRRHSLVRSARGLPHGGSRLDESAAGEEHRDRAERREGRLRLQSVAGGRSRRDPTRGRRVLSNVRPRNARRDRQHRRRKGRAARARAA